MVELGVSQVPTCKRWIPPRTCPNLCYASQDGSDEPTFFFSGQLGTSISEQTGRHPRCGPLDDMFRCGLAMSCRWDPSCIPKLQSPKNNILTTQAVICLCCPSDRCLLLRSGACMRLSKSDETLVAVKRNLTHPSVRDFVVLVYVVQVSAASLSRSNVTQHGQ